MSVTVKSCEHGSVMLQKSLKRPLQVAVYSEPDDEQQEVVGVCGILRAEAMYCDCRCWGGKKLRKKLEIDIVRVHEKGLCVFADPVLRL